MKPQLTIAATTVLVFIVASIVIGFSITKESNNKAPDFEEPIPPVEEQIPPPKPLPEPVPSPLDDRTVLEKEIDLYPTFYKEVSDNKCIPFVVQPKAANKKVNIVVIGYEQATLDDLKGDVNSTFFRQSLSLFNLEPFKSRQNDFNIWIYPSIIPHVSNTDYVDTTTQFYDARRSCTAHAFIILGKYISRSSSGGGTNYRVAISRATTDSVAHELGGHTIGMLADEYADITAKRLGRNITFAVYSKLNCDNSSACSKFSQVNIEGCFEGCHNYPGWYRTSSSSIMRSGGSFNKAQQFIINRRIDNLISKS